MEQDFKARAQRHTSTLGALIRDEVRDFAVVTMDGEGTITTWNAGAEAMFGYAEAEIVGRNLDVLFTKEDRAAGISANERKVALEKGCSLDERWHLRKNGTSFFVSGVVRPIRRPDESIDGFIKVGRDLTARGQLETALSAAEEQKRLIVDNVKDFAIIGLDPEGRITNWNPGAQFLFGYHPGEILGQHLEVLFPAEDRAKSFPQEELSVARDQGCVEAENWLVKKNGEQFFANQAVRPIVDASGSLCGFIKVARDITARKRAEERLEQTVAARTQDLQATVVELESFSYSMSHDLRAPLRAIISFSQLLAVQVHPVGPPATEYLERITRAAERMDRLIQDVLVYSRLGRHHIELKPIDLELLVRQIIAEHPLFQAPSALVELQAPLLAVQGHEASLTQCIYNLLGNAVKFVAPGVIPVVKIWTERCGSEVRVWFEDNGIGVPEADQAQIFGMFQRLHRETRYPGTGIGLALVRKAMKRMGGSVGVESAPDHGSRFWIQLSEYSQLAEKGLR